MYINSAACYVNAERNSRIILHANSYLLARLLDEKGVRNGKAELRLDNLFIV